MEKRRPRGAYRQDPSTHPPIFKFPSSTDLGGSEQHIVTATRKTARPQKPKPKSIEVKEKSSRVCQNRCRHTHNTQTGGPHPKSHLPTRGNLRSPRSPSPPYKCGADSSPRYVHLFCHHTSSSTSHCPRNGHSFVAGYGSTA